MVLPGCMLQVTEYMDGKELINENVMELRSRWLVLASSIMGACFLVPFRDRNVGRTTIVPSTRQRPLPRHSRRYA